MTSGNWIENICLLAIIKDFIIRASILLDKAKQCIFFHNLNTFFVTNIDYNSFVLYFLNINATWFDTDIQIMHICIYNA